MKKVSQIEKEEKLIQLIINFLRDKEKKINLNYKNYNLYLNKDSYQYYNYYTFDVSSNETKITDEEIKESIQQFLQNKESTKIFIKIQHKTKMKQYFRFLMNEDIQGDLLERAFQLIHEHNFLSFLNGQFECVNEISPELGKKFSLFVMNNYSHNSLHTPDITLKYMENYQYSHEDYSCIHNFLTIIKNKAEIQNNIDSFITSSLEKRDWSLFLDYLSPINRNLIASKDNDNPIPIFNDFGHSVNFHMNHNSLKKEYPHFTLESDYNDMFKRVWRALYQNKDTFGFNNIIEKTIDTETK